MPALDGFGLALSGGGYRASLFHLGAARRLHELGVLQKITRLSAVSGGSILSAHLAERMLRQPGRSALAFDSFEEEVANPFREFVRKDIRTPLAIKYVGRPVQRVRGLERALERLTSRRLKELPAKDQGILFIFLATDYRTGVAWHFEQSRMYSYKNLDPEHPVGESRIAEATAASACFPPLFGPMMLTVDDGQEFFLTDGGVYDNSGMEPIWKSCKRVLISDGGGTLESKVPKRPIRRMLRYANIASDQVRAQRQRTLIAQLVRAEDDPNGQRGTLWRIGSHIDRFKRGADQSFLDYVAARKQDWYGYNEQVSKMLTRVRTDLDSFTTAEACILENHGYYMTDVAVRRHLEGDADFARAPFNPPHKEYLDNDNATKALKHSDSRWFFWARWFDRT